MRSTQPHYDNGNSYDLIDVINDYGLNFCRGNILKYVVRAGKKKDELQDLLKAQDYLNREMRTNKKKQIEMERFDNELNEHLSKDDKEFDCLECGTPIERGVWLLQLGLS